MPRSTLKVNRFKINKLILITLIILIIVFYATKIANNDNIKVDNIYKSLNKIVASTINPTDLASLNITYTDKNSPIYVSIYSDLKNIHQTLSQQYKGIKSIYIARINENNVSYVADSLEEFDFGHVNFGDPMVNAPSEIWTANTSNETTVTKAYTNSQGEIVSIFTPIRNTLSGRTIGIIGMNIDAKYWNAELKSETSEIEIEIATIILVLLLALMFGNNILEKRTKSNLYKNVVDYARIPIFIINSQGIIVASNIGVEKTLGFIESDIKNHNITDIINKEDIIKFSAELSVAILASNINKIRIKFNSSTAHEVICDVYISLCPNISGENEYCSVILADVSIDVANFAEINNNYNELNTLYSKFTDKFLIES